MRTLFITYSYLGGHGGGVYASRTHINLFAELSEKMTLLYPFKQGQKPRAIIEEKIEMVPIVDTRSKLRKFIDLLIGKVHRFSLDGHLLNNKLFDIIVFDSSVVSSGLIKKAKKAGLKTITIHHNYQVQYLLGDCSFYTLIPNLFWTIIYERQAVRLSDLNLTLTNQDVELLRNHYCKTAPFAVLGVFEYQKNDIEELLNKKNHHNYVMTGGLHFKQTENSIIRWIKKYYPIMKNEDPLATLTIAGSNPSKKLTHVITSAGISLIPSPPDMKMILEKADYYLCPVDCGGGLKLRNLDGLKYGLPVLTHKVSLRGYEKMQTLGVLFSYDNKTEFIEGLRKMREIQLNSRQIQMLYINHYHYKRGKERLEEILRQFSLL